MLKDTFITLMAKYSGDKVYNLKCWETIEKQYSAKNRFYHNLLHLENMIQQLAEIAENNDMDMDSLLFAIYFHDIIYDVQKNDNEYNSSLYFEEMLINTHFNNIEKVKTLILKTKDHKGTTNYDENILLDLDLLILGSAEEIYAKYANNIRKEYSIFSDADYKKGRKSVLEHFLALDKIYSTDYFYQKYESRARKNIEREYTQLV
jgi:predicted metal-dependent HD superfamily phosphohydrolase